jgi:hypothetical protein
MTDAQTTAALYAAFDTNAIFQRQLKLNRNGVGPGHFGWLNTADGCKDSACMAANIADVSGACYSDAGVALAIGATNAVEQYFDVRFDIYIQDPPLVLSSANSPAVNVRKEYLPGHKATAVAWRTASPASASSDYYTYPSDRTLGTVNKNSNTLTDVASTSGVATGEPVVDAAGALASSSDNPATVSGSGGSTIMLSTQASETQTADGLTVEWTTSGLPEDVSFPNLGGAEGNGDWDCADYWAINHPHGPPAATVGTALGGVCGTPAQTTVSRYQVYRYEIAEGTGADGIAVWSERNGWASNGLSDRQGATNPPGDFKTESGAPFCASTAGVGGVDTTAGGVDRRNLIAPIINCLAQTALDNIPGAGTPPRRQWPHLASSS